ncbi:hypothetical protein TVAG_451780 [Trichomonas vaginalis G3]|uniref:Uncharacterized protein n=1 Tax=Trichomonas vaginalis (strain ATCC PRA-98 / G3) TaxID=412133 RepID=A2G5J1_TRIV3|nr:ATP binding [Trichomonas vaginalis G3]EAX87575.1 hypothetical protein TVAG_451780 [Trichomonas vaginalis G3]KAI5530037.1 ATP binding [Trichomonas vaginalis G3]|eukprot:XP_001300505.1 hypothetical protein [Trichomonas vaginalis G3]
MKHVMRADIRNVLRMMAETKIWLKEKQDIQKRLGPMDDPALKWYELQKLVDNVAELYKEATKIKNPTPDDRIHITGDVKYEL